MNYFQLLSDCNSVVGNCCSDAGIAAILDVLRRVFDLIQIIVPILLIICACIEFTRLVMDPNRKDGLKRIKNMFVAAVVVFFIPIFVDAVLNMMPNSFTVSSCWSQAKSVAESTRKQDFSYIVIDEQELISPFVNPDEYEKGKPKKTPSGGGRGPGGSIAPGDAKGILEGAEKVHSMYEQEGWAYYNDLDQLRWGDIKYSTNNPSRMTCCATFVGSALYIGGVFTESEINEHNYNSQFGISELCEVHGWTKISSYSQLAAGDIVIMSGPEGGSVPGHVQIYAGDGTWYNAGSTDAIQRDSPYSGDASARFLWAWRKTV